MTKIESITALALTLSISVSCVSYPPRSNDVGVRGDNRLAELSEVADVERRGEFEFIVRLGETSLFDIDQYALRAGAEQHLDRVAAILKQYPDFIIVVEGHTDNIGDDHYNQWLSEKRSHTVAQHLVEKGFDPAGIQVIGYGETRPIASNLTPEGREKNRRVEFHIHPKP